MLRHAAWMLWGLCTLGMLSAVGFLYVGFRAGRRLWQAVGVACAVTAVAVGTLMELAPTKPNGDVETDAWQTNVATLLLLLLFGATNTYAFFVNRSWTQWRLDEKRS